MFTVIFVVVTLALVTMIAIIAGRSGFKGALLGSALLLGWIAVLVFVIKP